MITKVMILTIDYESSEGQGRRVYRKHQHENKLIDIFNRRVGPEKEGPRIIYFFAKVCVKSSALGIDEKAIVPSV